MKRSAQAATNHHDSKSRRPPVELITPQVPPLYPPAPKPSQMVGDGTARVTSYKKFCQYLKTNYGVPIQRSNNSFAFNVHRYTDKYKNVVTEGIDIVPRIGEGRLPDELLAPLTKQKKKKKKKSTKALEDLPEDDEAGNDEGGAGPAVKKKREEDEDEVDAKGQDSVDEEDAMEEDVDEELDEGTDYAANYFDNGEDFIDSDNDGEEEGTY